MSGRNVLEVLGVYAGEAENYKGDVIVADAGKTVRVSVRGHLSDMTPEAAIVFSRMVGRCARRVIARRTPPS